MSLLAFAFAAVVLAITPGPGIAYVVARTVAGGRAEGLASCLGTGLGGLLHVLAAALGLSLIVAQSALAFAVVKYLGAAYLIYLGLRLLLRGAGAADVGTVARSGTRRAFSEGIAVEALNVKTALFFLAFLPQFVDPTRGAAWAQILALGLLFAALGFMSDATWALVAGTLGDRLRHSRRFPSVQRYVSGSVFVGLGAVAALTAPVKQPS